MESTGTAGGGMVTATVTGTSTLKSIAIKPDVVDPDDIDMLQDLVVAAVNEALDVYKRQGLTNNPSIYDVYNHPEKVKERQETILAQMLDQKMISQEEYELSLIHIYHHTGDYGAARERRVRAGDGHGAEGGRAAHLCRAGHGGVLGVLDLCAVPRQGGNFV